jgi:DNA-binding HxlR family transcriptional regulator
MVYSIEKYTKEVRVKKRPYRPLPAGCPVEATLDVIGGKYKGMILYHLLDGVKRFGELRRLMPDVTQRMLTLQLRELELAGVVNRVIYPQVPPKVEYSLTVFGRTLESILVEMQRWGLTYMARVATDDADAAATGPMAGDAGVKTGPKAAAPPR